MANYSRKYIGVLKNMFTINQMQEGRNKRRVRERSVML